MIVVCPACQARYKFDETKLGMRPTAKTRCAKCGGTIEIMNPLVGGITLPPEPEPPAPPAPPPARGNDETARSNAVRSQDPGRITMSGLEPNARSVSLPADKRYSLAIIQGPATGQIVQITKSRTTIGRSGADLNIDDPEASRLHASVEILGDTAILKDLGSTNGTWIENERIEQASLQNQMDFRIGSHVLMFIITALD